MHEIIISSFGPVFFNVIYFFISQNLLSVSDISLFVPWYLHTDHSNRYLYQHCRWLNISRKKFSHHLSLISLRLLSVGGVDKLLLAIVKEFHNFLHLDIISNQFSLSLYFFISTYNFLKSWSLILTCVKIVK